MKNLVSFSGRAGRSAYWLATIAGIVFYGMFLAIQATLDPWEQPQIYTNYYSGGTEVYWGTTDAKFIYGLFAIAGLILATVGLSVSIRRWHDLNKSGWWVLISLVPIVGGLYSFIMQGFVPGNSGTNFYDQDASIGTNRQRPARQHDALQALAIAGILSFIGGAMMVTVLFDVISDYMYYYRGWYEFSLQTYGLLSLFAAAAGLAWLVGSHYGSAFVERWGLRWASIVSDVGSGLCVAVLAIWSPPFLLLLILLFIGIALRVSAHTSVRSMLPEIETRIRLPFARASTLLDSFPYVAFLIVPLLIIPVRASYGSDIVEWLYPIFFAFSALFVAFALPSLGLSETSPAGSSTVTEPRMDADMTPADAVEWTPYQM